MKIRSIILKNSIVVIFSFFLLAVAGPSQAEDPWNSYKGWSGVETLSNQSSWYLGIVKKDYLIQDFQVFLKWYKYMNNTTDMRPNHWRINSAALSGQGRQLWICRGVWYYVGWPHNKWFWSTPSQLKPSFTMADDRTLLKTDNPPEGKWLGKVNEVKIAGVGYIESGITGFNIVDEITGSNYGVGGKDRYDEYINGGILVKDIQEGKHRIRPEVTLKTSFDDGVVDGVYKNFSLTFVNNRAVTFYVDRQDPVAGW